MIFDFIFLVFAELTNNGPIFETDFASKIRRTNCVFHIRFDFKKIENGLNILHCLCIIISLRSFSKSIFTRFLVGFTVARVSMFSVPLRKLSASTEYKLRLRFSFFWHFFFLVSWLNAKSIFYLISTVSSFVSMQVFCMFSCFVLFSTFSLILFLVRPKILSVRWLPVVRCRDVRAERRKNTKPNWLNASETISPLTSFFFRNVFFSSFLFSPFSRRLSVRLFSCFGWMFCRSRQSTFRSYSRYHEFTILQFIEQVHAMRTTLKIGIRHKQQYCMSWAATLKSDHNDTHIGMNELQLSCWFERVRERKGREKVEPTKTKEKRRFVSTFFLIFCCSFCAVEQTKRQNVMLSKHGKIDGRKKSTLCSWRWWYLVGWRTLWLARWHSEQTKPRQWQWQRQRWQRHQCRIEKYLLSSWIAFWTISFRHSFFFYFLLLAFESPNIFFPFLFSIFGFFRHLFSFCAGWKSTLLHIVSTSNSRSEEEQRKASKINSDLIQITHLFPNCCRHISRYERFAVVAQQQERKIWNAVKRKWWSSLSVQRVKLQFKFFASLFLVSFFLQFHSLLDFICSKEHFSFNCRIAVKDDSSFKRKTNRSSARHLRVPSSDHVERLILLHLIARNYFFFQFASSVAVIIVYNVIDVVCDKRRSVERNVYVNFNLPLFSPAAIVRMEISYVKCNFVADFVLCRGGNKRYRNPFKFGLTQFARHVHVPHSHVALHRNGSFIVFHFYRILPKCQNRKMKTKKPSQNCRRVLCCSDVFSRSHIFSIFSLLKRCD